MDYWTCVRRWFWKWGERRGEVHREGEEVRAIMGRQEKVPGRRSLRVLYIALYTELCGVPSVISIIVGGLACL